MSESIFVLPLILNASTSKDGIFCSPQFSLGLDIFLMQVTVLSSPLCPYFSFHMGAPDLSPQSFPVLLSFLLSRELFGAPLAPSFIRPCCIIINMGFLFSLESQSHENKHFISFLTVLPMPGTAPGI